MNLNIFFTSQQCKLAIDLLTEQKAPVKQELWDRYYELLEKEKLNEKNASGELLALYPHFCVQNKYSDDLKRCIEGTVDNLFALNLDAEDARKPGLLLGKIQSGKTRAFVGCMALAFDRGVDACIILTKGTNALVEQTIQRMNWDFRDCKRNARQKHFPTVAIYDIMKKRTIKRALINKEKNVFVAKKEDDNMRCLIDLFHNTEFKEKKILIIDDEADFVSRSFKQNKAGVEEGVIAGLIDELVMGLTNCRYLQVTATPYSLYLQPDEWVDVENGKVMPFRPRFTSIVPTFAQYVGSEQYFLLSAKANSMYSYLHHAVDPRCIMRLTPKKKNDGKKQYKRAILKNAIKTSDLIDLRWSIIHYFTASAIRELQVERETGNSYNTSFVMHVGVDKEAHEWEVDLIDELLNRWTDCIFDDTLEGCDFMQLFDDVYEELSKSNVLGAKEFNTGMTVIPAMPSKPDVLQRVMHLITEDEYNVQAVNSDQDMNSLLNDEGQLELDHMLNIFVGGNVLDRGITIGNMLGFFYGREPQIKQQASMLQHCRMYGNRSLADMAVTRLYAPQTLYDDLKQVNEMDDMMRAKFTDFVNNPNINPGIEFVYHDKSNGIIPCGPGNIAISKITWWKKSSFVLPSGHQTISSENKLAEIVKKIDQYFTGHNERECFEMKSDDAIDLVRLAREQFCYSRELNNIEYKWDEDDMIHLIKDLQKEGKIKAYRRLKCNTGRVRTDRRGFIDAPVDGQKESPYVKSEAKDVPVLLMQKEKGNKTKGWLGYDFYWPVLCLPQEMESTAYCPRKKGSVVVFENPLSEEEYSVNGLTK